MPDPAGKEPPAITTDAVSKVSRSRRRLYSAAVIFVAITVVAGGFAICHLRRDRIATEMQNTKNLAVVLSEQTARSFQAVDLVLREAQTMVRAAGIADPDEFQRLMATQEVHRFLVDRLQALPQANAISLIDNTGRIVSFSRAWPVPIIDTSDRDFFAHWRDHDAAGAFIGMPVVNKVTGAWVLTVTRRIDGPHGEFLGIVLGVVELRYFADFYQAISTSEGEAVTLFRQDGTILARYPHNEPMLGTVISRQSPWYGVMAAGGGTYRTPGYVGGLPRIISVEPVREYPLAITVGITEAVAFASWRRQSVIILISALGAIVAFALLVRALGAQFGQLEQSEVRFRGFALTSSDWFWETDEHHRFSYMSEGVSTIGFGIKPSSFIGHTRKGNAADTGDEADKWKEHFVQLEGHEPFRDFSYAWANPGGGKGIASISGDPFFDAKGHFLGYRGTGRDITELKVTEMRLHQIQEDLHRAQRLAKVGSDTWDLRTGYVTWSDETYRMFGVDANKFVPTSENFLNLVVPEDRPNLLARRKNILQGECPPACEFSIRRPDGEVRRIYSEGEIILDEHGKPGRWVGMRQDITAQMLAERGLREAKSRASN
jgi:PAS domain S-box-containing protein